MRAVVRRGGARRAVVLAGLSILALVGTMGMGAAWAANPPPEFVDAVVADEIFAPIQIEMAPDGRLIVLTDSGRAHVIKNDQRLATDLFDIRSQVDDVADRGLLSMAFDNNFAVNGYIYVLYTYDTNGVDDGIGRNRLSRFTVTGDTAGSEVVVFDQFPDADVALHYGGGLEMGPDGKLYVTVGDYLIGPNAQDNTNIKGTVLRLNTDGTIPPDNPFYDDLQGVNRAIFANGLRNPWQTAKNPVTGEIFISDVGSDSWEELNVLQAGANYGWRLAEGPADPGDPAQQGLTDPLWAFPHFGVAPGTPIQGCAIVGGDFYETPNPTFPAQYRGKYFSADYCTGQVVTVDPTTGVATNFMDGFTEIVDMAVSPVNGDLYYLDRRLNDDQTFPKGGVGKISYVGQINEISITTQPNDVSIAVGGTASFFVGASAPGDVTYQWRRNGIPIPGEVGPRLTIENVVAGNDGDQLAVEVSNGIDSLLSDVATLNITNNTVPVPVITITGVPDGYIAGSAFSFSGTATDNEDGTIAASTLQWEVRLNHDEHDHGLLSGITGGNGSITVPPSIETSTNVWVTVYLTATDSDGTSTTVTARIDPLITTVTLETAPGGLDVSFEGQDHPAPYSFDSVAGVLREVSAPATQSNGGTSYNFASWSDGFGRDEIRPTATVDETITATYTPIAPGNVCTVTALVDAVRIDWQDKPGTEVLRNAGGWVATPAAGTLSYTAPGAGVADGWLIRRTGGGGDEICTFDEPPPPEGCVVTAAPGGVLIDWDPVPGENRYQVRDTASGWIATVVNATQYLHNGDFTRTYEIKHKIGGVS
ncbi:MAG: hypothetical protein HKN94_08310, partial [Acidimicrobiales bacterium]|nr:hypothetical protein [Acidimicrobiales bacterium]